MRREIKPEWDNITKLSVEAENRGISYGRLQSIYYMESLGDYLQRDRVFEEYRSRQAAKKRKEREMRKQLADADPEEPPALAQIPDRTPEIKQGQPCRYCGKPVIGRRVYCDDYCRYMYRRKMEGKEL